MLSVRLPGRTARLGGARASGVTSRRKGARNAREQLTPQGADRSPAWRASLSTAKSAAGLHLAHRTVAIPYLRGSFERGIERRSSFSAPCLT